MELLLLFIDKIVTPKLSKHVGTQKARTSTRFLLKFWSEFYDCRMQLQSGGTPGCGCVAVCVYIAGLLADNVSDIYNVQCGQQIIPLKLISCSNWPLFYQLEPQQLGARGEERREDRIISDDVKTKAETELLYDVMMESEL